jgi:hypothetical protein
MPYFPINIDRCLATADQLHQSVHHHRGEAFPQEDLLEEVPIDPIVGLLKVKLQEQTLVGKRL